MLASLPTHATIHGGRRAPPALHAPPIPHRAAILAAILATVLTMIPSAPPARAQTARPGELSPYRGRLERLPVKLDDELFLVGTSSSNDRQVLAIAYRSAPFPFAGEHGAEVAKRVEGSVPLAADAGRLLGSTLEQAAFARREGDNHVLDVISLFNPGEIVYSSFPFEPPLPDAAFAVAVGDLDCFDEVTGQARCDRDTSDLPASYHDEVVLAHAVDDGGTMAVRITVLSYEDVELDDEDISAAPLPPTSVLTTTTTEVLSHDGRIVVRTGDVDPTNPGHEIVVVYVSRLNKLAVDIFGYRHTRAGAGDGPRDDQRELEHIAFADLSSSLPESTALAGGFDTVVGAGRGFGMDRVNSAAIVAVWQEGGNIHQRGFWYLNNQVTRLGQYDGPLGSFRLEDGSRRTLNVLPDSRVRASIGRISYPLDRCEVLGVLVLADTDRGPVVQSLLSIVEDPFIGRTVFGPATDDPAWPHAFELNARGPTTTLSRANMVGGAFVRSRNGLVDARPNTSGIGGDVEAETCDNTFHPYLGHFPAFYVALPEERRLVAVTLASQGGFPYWDPSFPDDQGMRGTPVPYFAPPGGTAPFAPTGASVDMDVDGDGAADPATDGQLMLRYLFGFRGETLIAGAVGNDCTRCTAQEIEARLDAIARHLDADADGSSDALTDGLVRLRFLSGLEGDALVEGAVSEDCRRCAAGEIETYLELDDRVDDVPILLAVDADGDAAFRSSFTCVRPQGGSCADGRRLFIGDAVLHYVLENMEAPEVVLQEPPKHVDYLPELGGITNVSVTDDFFTEFSVTDEAGGMLEKKSQTDWTLGAGVAVGFGPPVPPGIDFNSAVKLSLDVEHSTSIAKSELDEVTLRLTQVSGAIRDDVVWTRVQSVDYWRFPAMGGERGGSGQFPPRSEWPMTSTESGLPEDAYFEIAVPGEVTVLVGPGQLNESYEPFHQNGNILTYPAFSGSNTGLGDLFASLGSYVPRNQQGGRDCVPLAIPDALGDLEEFPGCLVERANGVVEMAQQVLDGEILVGGDLVRESSPIRVADIIRTGGVAFRADLEFERSVTQGIGVTNNNTVKAGAELKAPVGISVLGVPLQVGEIEANIRASASFQSARLSTNEVSSETRISLHVPPDLAPDKSYAIRPSFHFTPSGGLKVTHQVSVEGPTEEFWFRHYSGRDPALNLPFRIVRDPGAPGGLALARDSRRDRMKGFFIRDGSQVDPLRPSHSVGDLLDGAPADGDPVQIEVRVFNLSLATPVSDLLVRFEAIETDRGGREIGPRMPIGDTVIPLIPYRGQVEDRPNAHIASAFIVWDTTGLGAATPDELRRYKVVVTLDPRNAIPDETHEWEDRFEDPLLDDGGEPIDPVPGTTGRFLEKGQNNTGRFVVNVAPKLGAKRLALRPAAERARGFPRRSAAPDISLRHDSLSVVGPRPETADGGFEAVVGEPLRLRVAVYADRLVRDHGVLRIFEGDPENGGRMIAARHVLGLEPGAPNEETFTWYPERPGEHVLAAAFDEPLSDRRQGNALDTLRVRVRPRLATRRDTASLRLGR